MAWSTGQGGGQQAGEGAVQHGRQPVEAKGHPRGCWPGLSEEQLRVGRRGGWAVEAGRAGGRAGGVAAWPWAEPAVSSPQLLSLCPLLPSWCRQPVGQISATRVCGGVNSLGTRVQPGAPR